MRTLEEQEQYKELIIHAYLTYKGYRKIITSGNFAAHIDSILDKSGSYEAAFVEVTNNFRQNHTNLCRITRKQTTEEQKAKGRERYRLYKQSPEWLEKRRIARKAYYEKNKK